MGTEILGKILRDFQKMLLQTYKERLRNVSNSRDKAALTFRKMLTMDVLYIRQPLYGAVNLTDV
jgi:hypothetical protein